MILELSYKIKIERLDQFGRWQEGVVEDKWDEECINEDDGMKKAWDRTEKVMSNLKNEGFRIIYPMYGWHN